MNKTILQELCQKRRWDLPQYTTRRVETGREPRFVATVTVNGLVFESPGAESISVKEAQNKAATVAFEALSAAPAVDAVPSPLLLPAVESLSPRPSTTESNATYKSSIESNATYKSQLLVYAQKRSKQLPEYTTVRVGSPHAPQFKAAVVIDGLTFECPQFFKTVREAEHAAAEVALANLPKEESFQHNLQDELTVPYKTLLQEYTQKSKQLLPVYTTVKDPDSSLILFLSTVEVCGRTFRGVASKTKKQAESSAAKVAVDHFDERKQSPGTSCGSANLPVNDAHSSCSFDMKTKLTVPPVSLSPPVRILTEDQVLPGNQASAAQESKPLLANPKNEPIEVTKDCNLDPTAQSNLGLTADSVSSEGAVLAATKDNGNEGIEQPLLCNKIQVYPHNPGSAVPHGAISLPFSDKTWVAVSLDFL